MRREVIAAWTLFIDDFQVLYAFKLTQLNSFESKLLNYQLKIEASWANFNTHKRIFV